MDEATFKVPSLDSKNVKTNPSDTDPPPVQPPDNDIKLASQYREPNWSSKPTAEVKYCFEVLKNGQIIEMIKDLESQSYWMFGRLPQNHISMAHPTVSRFHLVLQYSAGKNEETPEDKDIEPGWYIFDMGSTHGTFLNKQRIPIKTYIRIRVGHMLKLGASTRQYILMGPESDEEAALNLTITEVKAQKQKQLDEILKNREEERKKPDVAEEGVSWGMGEDADEETDLSVNPFASSNNEELFLDDPKKTLRGFFEREGHNLEYKVEDLPNTTFVCRIELPIDDDLGRTITAEVTHKGKKKECVLQCALEACRILDRHGVLRKANHEPMRRRKRESDSDDGDDYLDRTGDVEKKKLRKSVPQSSSNNSLSYSELLEQEQVILEGITKFNVKIEKYQKSVRKPQSSDDIDDLDVFMSNLKEEKSFDKVQVRKFRVEQQKLRADLKHVQKMIQVAKPVELPQLVVHKEGETPTESSSKISAPLFGKKIKLSKDFGIEKKSKTDDSKDGISDDEEEMIPESSSSIQRIKESQSADISIKDDKEIANETISVEKLPGTGTIETPEKVIGPKSMTPEDLQKITSKDKTSTSEPAEKPQSRKRPQRVRNRNEKPRENIDIDESEEHPDKYAGWVPPENQEGDGMTSLNEKLGY